MKVAIIGAGIIGLALARELRRRGANVVLVERQAPANEATWAAAGMLAPSAEAAGPGDLFELCVEAAARYPDYIRELEQETGLATGYCAQGAMFLYDSDEARREVEARFSWQRERGIPIVHLDAQEVRVLEPEVRAPGGYLLPGESHVDSRRLAAALVEACRRSGVDIVKGTAVEVAGQNTGQDTGQDNRPAGVLLDDGSRLTADAVVNAAGAWASTIAAVGAESAAIRPVKGQMLAVAAPGWSLTHVLHAVGVYVVPQGGGRLFIGSTMEEAGFGKTVDRAVIARLRAAAERVVPRLAQSLTVETWTGLRPASPDGQPRIGPTALPGYFLATGHFRNGILLGPLTAQLLAPVILGVPPEPLLTPFLPDPRFLPE